MDEDNVLELMKGHDLAIEAVDDMPSRVIIHRTARELGIPSVGMSGSGTYTNIVLAPEYNASLKMTKPLTPAFVTS
ncbi:hypothetical protein AYJ08_08210 [Brevibacillus sp. SKDU10]|nr:hypothetical protein AYJ08_08210 [Brevibacillus sp. SKDU10]